MHEIAIIEKSPIEMRISKWLFHLTLKKQIIHKLIIIQFLKFNAKNKKSWKQRINNLKTK